MVPWIWVALDLSIFYFTGGYI